MKAQPGDHENTIISNSLLLLTNPPFGFMNPRNMAPRVIFWYRLFTLGRSPIVVINAAERKVGKEYAGLTGAVRTLVDDYKLRVVVDGSPNSLEDNLLQTMRERVYDIKPMTKEMVWQMEQFQDLFTYVKAAGLNDTVFAVLGGIPSHYEKLWESAQIALCQGQDARDVIGFFLCGAIYVACEVVRTSRESADMNQIISLFDKHTMCILCYSLTDKRLQQPTPDKVFRKVEQDGNSVLIPASNAIGIVLQHNLKRKPSLNELEELLKTKY